MTDEIVMYLCVRTDLPMSPGKVAAQVGHGVQLAIRRAEVLTVTKNSDDLRNWEAGDYAKVILGGDKRDFEKLCKLASEDATLGSRLVKVIDNGRTEVPAGSMTILAFVPMRKSEAKKWVGRLRLYR